MKYFSMFSGIGGFELGIENAYRKKNRGIKENKKRDDEKGKRLESKKRKGNNDQGRRYGKQSNSNTDSRATCIGFSEIDKYAIETYRKHFPKHKNYGDATKINPRKLPDFDLLCGGFPCQSFSIAGKRMGFKDTRGTLFFDIARIAKVKRPQILFIENVKGLLNHDSGRTFTTILATLDELGYNAEWQVLNSKYFGVPQNRERVFIIGHLRGKSTRQVFPIGQSSEKLNSGYARVQVAASLQSPGHACGNYKGMNMILEITGNRQGYMVYKPDGIMSTNSSSPGGITKDMCIAVSKTIRVGGQKSPHGSKQNWDSYEIDGNIRRLTPTECERLQGFPDGWTIGSDTQRYKQCGNAVTVNVIQAIMEKIISTQINTSTKED